MISIILAGGYAGRLHRISPQIKTTLVSTGIYILPKLREYIESDRNTDELGRLLERLLEFEPIYDYILSVLSGEWYGIGTQETYRRTLERFSSR